MIRFSWDTVDVLDKITALPSDTRAIAHSAYNHLLRSRNTLYTRFVERHREWLQTELPPERPLRFIEEVGIECAVWPHLYWHSDLCETVHRATDARRLRRNREYRQEFASDSD